MSLSQGVAFGAQGRGNGHAHGRGTESADRAIAIDRDGDRRIVRDYYVHNSLPPGLQKRLTPVPVPLEARLPGLPPYYSRYFAGPDLLVVDRRSNRIVSVIPNIF